MISSLPTWKLRNRTLLPIVQGGMGVGISAHRLAGNVARLGAVGTISSVDLRHHHPDLLAETEGRRDKDLLDRVNLVALDREIKAALNISRGSGAIAVNVMKAVSAYAAHVRQSCESGAHAIVMGAGLPLDLPDMTRDFPEVALIPILSDARGTAIVLKKWLRKKCLPDAIVIEHPRYAGGHLGAAKLEDVGSARFDFAEVVPAAQRLFEEMGIAPIPLIVAGGINSPERVRQALALGAAGVQVGTPFAVTEECDAHPNFKAVLAEARPQDIVTFMSTAGLPARAVLTPWLKRYLAKEGRLRSEAAREGHEARCPSNVQCLASCGFKDGNPAAGQFCIETQLAAAQRGSIEKGLFFRGSESLPFGSEIRSVQELLERLLTDTREAVAAFIEGVPALQPL